jgi:hypothetical protein
VVTFLGLGLVQTVARPRFDHPARELLEFSMMGVVLVVAVLASARLLFAVVGGALLVTYVRWRDGCLRIDERVTRWTPIVPAPA